MSSDDTTNNVKLGVVGGVVLLGSIGAVLAPQEYVPLAYVLMVGGAIAGALFAGQALIAIRREALKRSTPQTPSAQAAVQADSERAFIVACDLDPGRILMLSTQYSVTYRGATADGRHRFAGQPAALDALGNDINLAAA